MLLTVDLNGPAPRARGSGEYFIDVKRITIAPMLSLQSSGIETSKLDTPQADCFATYLDASFG